MKNFYNLIILLLIFFFLTLLFYSGNKIFLSSNKVFLNYFHKNFFICSFLLCYFFIASLKFKIILKSYVAIIGISFLASIYFFEFYLFYSPFLNQNNNNNNDIKIEKNISEVKEKKSDTNFNNIEDCINRKNEVILNEDQIIRSNWLNNKETYPDLPPISLVETNGISNIKGKIYPLGHISNVYSVFGNEECQSNQDDWIVNQMDEYGFNNPLGSHTNKNIDLVILGDSFGEGYGVKSNYNIGSILRNLSSKEIPFSDDLL